MVILDLSPPNPQACDTTMRIACINIPSSGARPGHAGLFLPYGLACITAVARQHGHQCDCFDLHNEEILRGKSCNLSEFWRDLADGRYQMIAFGGTFMKMERLTDLSQAIWRIRSNVFQLAGGNMASIASEYILRKTRVNGVCLYEGEDTFAALLKALEQGRPWQGLAGIAYLDNNRCLQASQRDKTTDLDALPWPDRESWNFDCIRKAFPYGSPGRYSAVVFASRGCPFNCTFCNPVSGRVVRARSVESILGEIKHLIDRHQVRYIRFFDEVFLGSKKRIRDFCLRLIESNLDFYWWCQLQIKLVDRELLGLMRQAGCIEIGYGIESGSNRILAEMRKGITREQSRQVILMTAEAGIRPSLSLIAGTRSESKETLAETQDFLLSINHVRMNQPPSIGHIVPIPGTDLYRQALDAGLIHNEQDYLLHIMDKTDRYHISINLTSLPTKELQESIGCINKTVRSDYFRRHPGQRLLALVGLDHLRLDLLWHGLRRSDLRAAAEAVLWAILGKRKFAFSRFLASRFIYGRGSKRGTACDGPAPSRGA